MISETIRRFTILILLGAASVVGFPSTGNGGGSTSGKVIHLQEVDTNAVAVLGEGVVGKALPAVPIADTARLCRYDLESGHTGSWRENTRIPIRKIP